MIIQAPFSRDEIYSEIQLITIEDGDMKASFTNYGATLVSLIVKDMNGKDVDVCLGFDSIEGYLSQDAYIGGVVGRYANRIKNGEFVLNDRRYVLYKNDGANHLHGGLKGFDKQIYNYKAEGSKVIFFRTSEDGEEGYPGNVDLTITYQLMNNTLYLWYDAESDRDTLFNPSLHAYFNFTGEDTIKNHYLTLPYGTAYTPCDKNNIPTGEIKSVFGTPFDFTKKKMIGADISSPELEARRGYDHNFVIKDSGFRQMAEVIGGNGIKMLLLSDMPGLQVYTGNYLCGYKGKGGKVYGQYAGLALEPQFYPDSPNKEAFPSSVLKAYHHVTYHNSYVFEII